MLVFLNVQILPAFHVSHKKRCCVQDIQNLSANIYIYSRCCKGVGMFQRKHAEIKDTQGDLKKTV